MGLVAAALALLLAGCYSPSLRDCTLSCAASNECATGQSCTANGWCAAAGAACAPSGGVIDAPLASDGSIGAVDAPTTTTDAAPPADAALVTYPLQVQVIGGGKVIVDGIGTCDGNGNGGGQQGLLPTATPCTYQVLAGTQVTAHATDVSQSFDKWTDPICKQQGALCMFTIVAPTLIQAHFK